jgi:hypothetical protein
VPFEQRVKSKFPGKFSDTAKTGARSKYAQC